MKLKVRFNDYLEREQGNNPKWGKSLKIMKYLVYLTLCIPNNKIYIGVHETVNPDVFDGYIGNGVNIFKPSSYKKSKTPFHYAVNKYGVDAFKRTTLAIFEHFLISLYIQIG